MKVLILTEGGKNIGFGHLTRSLSLFQAIKEEKSNIDIEFVIFGDEAAKKFFKIHNVNPISFDWINEVGKTLSMVEKSDMVIIDSYLAKKELYNYISSIMKGKLLMIDDYNRIEYPKGIVVNPSIYGDSLNYPKKKGVRYLLGKDYIILRKAFWDVPRKKINKEIKDVLVTFGGMNHSNLAIKIVNFLKKKFDFHFFVIDSTKKKLTDKEMLNLMLKADICISGGGQTTYELARVGVPTIGICFAENQKFNLEDWHKIGFMEYGGWHNGEKIFGRLVSAIEKLKDKKERLIRSGIGQNAVDGKGTQRIINEVFKIWG